MDICIQGALALLPDQESEGGFILKKKDIYISGKKIRKITEPGSESAESGWKVLPAEGKLVMPGLINAHTHAYMSLFRNYADDEAFWDWLSKVQEVEEDLTEEDCYWGTLLNCIEMIQTGTTCFVDMNIRSAKAAEGPASACAGAAAESGMRAVLTRGLAGSTSEEAAMLKFGQALKEMELFQDHDRLYFWFGPHAPYSCMADYLQKITQVIREKNRQEGTDPDKPMTGQTIHLSESVSELENMQKETGKTPIGYVNDLGIFEVPVIAAHCVQARDEDIRIFKEKNVAVAINPKSNMKLGNGFAPVKKFQEAGLTICLGTDGCGSNNTQNMFAEMNAAALIYKGANESAQCISAEDVLQFATVGGAKAIGMEGKLGVLKEGALADLVILDLYAPQFFPSTNILSGLVYSATGKEVETVIINGQIVMENRKILTIDVDRVYAECEKICDRLHMFTA